MGGAAGLIAEGAKAGVGMSGNQQAAQYEALGQQRGQDIQLEIYKRNMAESAPWRATGQAALAELASIYGLPSYGSGGTTYDSEGNVISYERGTTGFEQMEKDIGFDKLKKTHGPAAALIAPDPYLAKKTADFKGFPMISELTDPGIEFGDVDVGQALAYDYTPSSGTEDAYAKFASLPQYQFQIQEAEKAANRAAAARGTYAGGAQMRALQDISQGTAAQGFDSYVAGLRNLAGLGGEFTQSAAAQGTNLGTNLASSFAGQGSAAAQGAINQSNVIGQGISGAAQWYGQQQGYGGGSQPTFGGYGSPPPSGYNNVSQNPYGMQSFAGYA